MLSPYIFLRVLLTLIKAKWQTLLYLWFEIFLDINVKLWQTF